VGWLARPARVPVTMTESEHAPAESARPELDRGDAPDALRPDAPDASRPDTDEANDRTLPPDDHAPAATDTPSGRDAQR
jgi:hypothetical protein